MKKWFYQSFSAIHEPRSVVNQDFVFARTRKEAIDIARTYYKDGGRWCWAYPVS